MPALAAAADSTAWWQGDDGLALTAEARAKVAVYAKGDEAWAAHLVGVAAGIAREQGWTEITLPAVKAALLQCWTRERRLPASAAKPGAGRSQAAAGDGPFRRPQTEERPTPPPPADAAAPPTVDGKGEEEDDAAGRGLIAVLRGDRFSYLIVFAACILAALFAWPLLRNSDDPLPPIALPPLPALTLEPAAERPTVATPSPAPKEAAATPALPQGRPAMATAEVETNERDVREAQVLLARLGYRPGTIDGKAGPQTVAAVRAFQRDIDEKVDGAISPRLLHQLRSRVVLAAPPPQIAPAKPSTPAPAGNVALRTVGRWLGAAYDSRYQPAAIEAHCRAVPDNWIFDEAVGDLVHCSRFVPNPPPIPTREHP